MGERTAELHLALAGNHDDAAFAPEPYSDFYRLALYHGILTAIGRAFQDIRARTQWDQRATLPSEEAVRAKVRPFRDQRFFVDRIRIHGHYQLTQVLFTGKDLMIVDFEGDPSRNIVERAIKRAGLRDVAAMLISLRRASLAARAGRVPGVIPQSEDSASLEVRSSFWYRWSAAAFLKGYLDRLRGSSLLPKDEDHLRLLLDTMMIEAAASQIVRERDADQEALAVLSDLTSSGRA